MSELGKKSVIVYYSWIGNTEVVAKEIQRLTGFDVIKIEEKKERPLGKAMSAAMGAIFGFGSKIKAIDFTLQNYDTIFIGTQVWAGKTSPAINTFLKKANLKGKDVWLLITKADEKVPQAVIDSMTARIVKKGGVVKGFFAQTTKWDPKTNIPITTEEVKASVEDWVNVFL